MTIYVHSVPASMVLHFVIREWNRRKPFGRSPRKAEEQGSSAKLMAQAFKPNAGGQDPRLREFPKPVAVRGSPTAPAGPAAQSLSRACPAAAAHGNPPRLLWNCYLSRVIEPRSTKYGDIYTTDRIITGMCGVQNFIALPETQRRRLRETKKPMEKEKPSRTAAPPKPRRRRTAR